MQYVPIKIVKQDGKELYGVNAIPLKNKNKSLVQKIPHPLGTDIITYETVEQAKEAIIRAGFSYILPSGEKIAVKIEKTKNDKPNYETLIYDTIKEKVNSSNTSVAASAVYALSEFPTEETFNILFEKIGEENEQIRKNAILGICRYEGLLQKEIINALKSENWIKKNSAIACIQRIIENNPNGIDAYISPLLETCSDPNPIVQANAITTIAQCYKEYKKQQS